VFEAFHPAPADVARTKRLAASTIAAMMTYGAVAGAAVLLGGGAAIVQEKVLDVTFEKQLPKEVAPPAPPPPPPPPPKKIEKPKAAPPPVVNEAPPPPKAPPPVVVPQIVPKDVLPESDVAIEKREFIPPAEGIGGTRKGSLAGTVGGVPGGTGTAAPAVHRAALLPVNLPEEATPPVESPVNRRPEYPESARAAGVEGLVILKIVVTETGRVGNIQVMKGEPPFVEAAMSAVKTYTFQPAMLGGRPISVFRIIKVPFRLSVGGVR
jgi:periplasmic protein TonB